MECVGFLEAADEAGGEGGGVADVGEGNGFHGGMHVAKRDGNEPAGNAVAGRVDDVGVRTGAAGDGFVLDRDFVFGCDLDEALHDEWMVRSTVGNSGSFAEFDEPIFLHADAGGVGGVGDVEDNRNRGADAVGYHLSASTADFFLHGIRREGGRDRAFLCGSKLFEDEGENESADAVV